FGKKQMEILVTPREVADIWGLPVQMLLQPPMVFVSAVRRNLFEQFHSFEQLVAVLACNGDGLFERDRLWVAVFVAFLPLPCFLAAENAELQGTATCDTAETVGE